MKTCMFTEGNRSEWHGGGDHSRIDDISGFGEIQVAEVEHEETMGTGRARTNRQTELGTEYKTEFDGLSMGRTVLGRQV